MSINSSTLVLINLRAAHRARRLNLAFVGAALALLLGLGGCQKSQSAPRTTSPVISNRAPVVVNLIEDQEGREGAAFRFVIPANIFSDPDGDPLTLSAALDNGQPLPRWLTFDRLTRVLAGTPAASDGGTIILRLTAMDPAQASAATALRLKVKKISVIPTDVSDKINILGLWSPVAVSTPSDHPASPIIAGYAVLPLGAARSEGIALTAWAYSGVDWEKNPAGADTMPIDIILLDQTTDGHLRIATDSYVDSPRTNGGNTLIVTDLNQDNLEDLVFLAHNESPFIAKPSTVLLSEGPQHFRRGSIADQVMAHDAQLVTRRGKPTIVTMSFETAFPFRGTFPRALRNPYFTWTPAGLITPHELVVPGGGMSATAADLVGNGSTVLVVGDSAPLNYTAQDYADVTKHDRDFFSIRLFDWTTDQLTPRGDPLLPYFSARTAYQNKSSNWGKWVTHIPRVWTDDFNQDGHLDILASTSMWPEGLAMLQLLQNDGGGRGFTDRTDDLNPEYSPVGGEVDYSMQRRSIDRSGIKTYFLANIPDYSAQPITNASKVLLNDGTGRLYQALSAEFNQWSTQVQILFSKRYPYTFNQPCRFIAYANAQGLWNFLAFASVPGAGPGLPARVILASIATELDVLKIYRKPVVVAQRNQSKNIRTFEGDDIIFRESRDPDATVDGRGGEDVAVYPLARSAYAIVKMGEEFKITQKDFPAKSDLLRHVERVRFSDLTIDLSTL